MSDSRTEQILNANKALAFTTKQLLDVTDLMGESLEKLLDFVDSHPTLAAEYQAQLRKPRGDLSTVEPKLPRSFSIDPTWRQKARAVLEQIEAEGFL